MPTSASTTKIVLVAAETPVVRERFKAALEQAGHRVVPIASAGELLARVRFDDTDIDLLIVDLHLSNSIGTGLVAAVRKLNENRLPILVFSGTVSTAEDVRDLARMKVAGYINEHCATQQILPAVAPHLFPDSFNRRGNPRVVLGVPVQYRVDGTIAAALTLNLSHGGVGIRTTSPLTAGTQVRVRFKLPGTDRDAESEGRVAWSDRRVGMGVQFDALDAAGQLLIDNFVDAHFFSNRKA